ncbi:MAG TPA: ATP phosphoribosyltransferase regulatory subunit, partial [Vicinamibacteria bacterium]|nr:ATP phosphoribosyltransferase regulatory subunit [Vicinamibacteria bacterium]
MAPALDHRLVQIPPGVQCFVGDEARRRRAIESVVTSVFEGWDYDEIIPPLYDYADVFEGPSLARKTFSFLGRDGSVLALRPDFTSLLAKIAAGRLSELPPPIRLYYAGEVLRYEPPKAGRQSELYQMGLERLGGERALGDAEVVAIAAECLQALGASDFVLALGHVGVFAGLLESCSLDPALRDVLRARVESKDASGVREAARSAQVPEAVGEALVKLTELAGGLETLEEARKAFAFAPGALLAVEELAATAAALVEGGLRDSLAIDLGEVRGFDYYTGLIFRVYARGLGFEVGAGGRYDSLLARFGRPMPAVGFMLGLDRIALLLERQGKAAGDSRAPAALVASSRVADALRQARARRAQGTRVRL